jgi:RecA-family ATPase
MSEKKLDATLVDMFAVAEADLPTRDWMLSDCYDNGICERGQLSVFGGNGGGGKSVTSLGMAIALASGKQFGPWIPKRAYRVMMLNAEDTADDQRRRVYAALHSKDAYGIMQADIEDRLTILVSPNMNLIAKNEKKKTIDPEPLLDWLNEEIHKREFDFLFLDPLVELSVGCNENDNSEMHRVVAILRQLARARKVHAMVVHHFRKGAGAADSGKVRGAGAITALGRFNINIERLEEKDAGKLDLGGRDPDSVYKLTVAKNNHGPTGSTHYLCATEQEIANGETVVAMEHFKVKSTTVDITTELIERFLMALEKGPSRGTKYNANTSGPGMAATLLTEEAFGLERGAAKKLIEKLTLDGRISLSEYGKEGHLRLGYIVHRDGRPLM